MWQLNRVNPIKHDDAYKFSTDTFAGDSTYVNDYKTHKGQAPRQPIKPDHVTAIHSADGLRFNDSTGYRADFVKHSMPARYTRPRDEYTATKEPLDSLTTNKLDYTAKDIEPMK